MYKLTTGDLRYIAQSTRAWKETIDTVINKIPVVPRVVQDRIRNLSDKYKEDLVAYYLEAMRENEGRLADSILWEFDVKWDTEHPEYYDIDLLIKECRDSDKANARDAIAAVKECFS